MVSVGVGGGGGGTRNVSGSYPLLCGFSAHQLQVILIDCSLFIVMHGYVHTPYGTYYKHMGDLPYISCEQVGLIIRTELIYELPSISVLRSL